MPLPPLYIFDLDGTLCHIEHRRHFVSNGNHRWPEFYAACVDDTPNWPVIQTLRQLSITCDVWIFSGRSDEVREQTEKWIFEHVHKNLKTLEMRHQGDYTPDDVLKEGWLHGMLLEDRVRLVAVFEDRDRMVKMWRRNGVACFQVAPGDF